MLKDKANAENYSPIISGTPRKLDTIEDLKKPNAYLHDWVYVAILNKKIKNNK